MMNSAHQVSQFVSVIFDPPDIIEARRLPFGKSSWVRADKLGEIVADLSKENEQGQGIYIGANPRKRDGGTKNEDVALARCLFADFDGVDLEIIPQRVKGAGLADPTLIVASGHGFHCYWRLDEPVTDLALWSQFQRRLIATLDSDKAIHDPARIMRLPGFMNRKPPKAICEVVEAAPSRRYPLVQLAGRLKVISASECGTASVFNGPATTPTSSVSELELVRGATLAAAKWPAVCEGHRNTEAFHHAAYLVKDFGLANINAWPILQEWNSQNEPPLSELELRKCLDSAVKNGKHPVGSKLLHNSETATNGDEADPYGVYSVYRVTPDSGIYRPAWPKPLAEEAYHGLVGEATRIIEPHSEADPTAILIQFLVFFGNLIGKSAHFVAEGAKHYLNLFTVLVGATSKGRKGSSMAHVRNIYQQVEPPWVELIQSGLSSGEGLIWAVRDPIYRIERDKKSGSTEEVLVDPGVNDKRLLVIESEFASVLRVAARDGNTLSAILRNAWDGGSLQTMTKNNPAKATDAHISVVGHIVKEELCRYLTTTEAGNGFGNRFLWVCVRRSKALPEGGSLDIKDLSGVVSGIIDARDFSKKRGQIKLGVDALRIWKDIYAQLSAGKSGLLGAMISRAEAQVMRLACVYALLDLSLVIGPKHLLAALAIWEYCEESAKHIFGSSLGDPVADEVLRVLKATPEGLTRNDIRNHFGRNHSAARITHALAALMDNNLAHYRQEQTDGRPAERWFAGDIQYAVNAINAVRSGSEAAETPQPKKPHE
jgi:hypothetical protein